MHYRTSALLAGLLFALYGSAGAQQPGPGPFIQVSPTPSKLSVGGPGFVQIDAQGVASIAAAAPGSGTVTNTGGALLLNHMVVGNGGADIKTLGGTVGGAFTTAGAFTTTGAVSGVTLAFPSGGPFTYTFPLATATLASLAGSETFTNKIYSGGQLSGSFSGNPTFLGIPLFTNLLSGTQTTCLGLDASFHLVTSAGACGAGGSGITIGTTAITSGTTTRILFDNAGVVGEYAISGSGSVAMTTSPTFATGLNINMGATQGNLAARLDATYNQLSFNTANTIYVEGGGTPDNNMYLAAPTSIVMLPSTGSFTFNSNSFNSTTDNTASSGTNTKRWTTVHSFGSTLWGATSGSILVQAPAVAGSGTITLPTTPGSTQCLHMAATGVVTTTGSDCGSSSASGTVTNSANLTNNAPVIGDGGTVGVKTTAAMTNGQVLVGATGAAPVPQALSQDCTMTSAGVVTCTKTNNVAFATSATTDTTNASNISAGTLAAARGGAGTITGALKGNGSGVVSQAACADLSNGATGCSTATGTSGATLPLLNGTNTWSGTQTFGTIIGTVVARSGTTDTLAAGDCGTTIEYTSASAVTVTGPNSLVIGCHIAIVQGGAGQVTVAAGTGASLVSAHSYTKTFGQNAGIGLSVIENSGGAAAKYFLFGDGA